MSNDKETTDQTLILAIETATRAGGVAVARGETVLETTSGDASISHSTNLLEIIDGALRRAGVLLADIELFAVASGPGSFTGLRIGLATAKAFAVHLRRDVIGVSTLAAVAHSSKLDGNIVALLPAGRGEVFAQRFTLHEGIVAPVDEPQHLTPRAVREKYAAVEGLQFAGDGVPMVKNSISDSETSILFASESPILAPSIAVLGYRAYQDGKAVPPENLQAVYVRASDAEINERWQKQQQPANQ